MKDRETHLKQFVNSFISREARHRWRYFLLDKPDKAKFELKKIERCLNQQTCWLVDSVSDVLIEISGTVEGLYFDCIVPPVCINLQQAIDESTIKKVDAIFSILPGEKAVFLFHEGWAWVCEK